ncbi:MAG: hypothetical protein J5965_13470, partial [Aeriscardovia sp.]|nr:hypothetical protein [Aeriscardovia sp.]
SVAAIESQNNFAALRSGSYFRLPTAHKNIYFLFFKKIFSCTSFVNLACFLNKMLTLARL